MKKEYYAHSLPNKRPEEGWQSLNTHLENVAELAEAFAREFASSNWAGNAAWLHDLGKADDRFQGYLLRENGLDDSDYDSGRINHSSAGSAFAENKFGPCLGRILAYIIAGHHAGLPDWDSAETGAAALSARLGEGKDNLARISGYATEIEAKLKKELIPPEFALKPENIHLWIRMLYSCIVDADFLDTEKVMSQDNALQRVEIEFRSLAELKIVFDAYMVKFAKPKTEINAIRQEILGACRSAAQQPSGLFSLTVPTGGGKTLSGVAFALDHAMKHGKK